MNNELAYVVNNSKYVKINNKKLEEFIKVLELPKYTHWSEDLNIDLNENEWIILSIVIESMNFCFWKKPKWKIKYNGNILSGSAALFFTILKEVIKDKTFLEFDNLKKVDYLKFKEIFNGVDSECPFLEERYNNFKEVTEAMSKENFFRDLFTIKSDIELQNYLVTIFPCFNDSSLYKNMTIHFYKRATLLTNDLFWVSKTIRKNIKNVNNLLGCADYGIPRTLRDYGILEYNKKLSSMIENEQEIHHDSIPEIEIRANMLYVIEYIRKSLNKKNIFINSVELDNIIWNMGHKIEHITKSHHTVTIYY